ncbi:hypothetical protein Tco_0444866 [Tanacetum coccineum]
MWSWSWILGSFRQARLIAQRLVRESFTKVLPKKLDISLSLEAEKLNGPFLWLFKSAIKSCGSTLDRRWKLPSWSTVRAEGIFGEATKARGANGIRYPSSPSRKRWILGAVRIDPCSAVANALSIPPGETLPGLDMPRILLKERGAFGNADTGGAWLSSARATAGDKPEEGEDERPSHHALMPWATHVLQWPGQRVAIPRGHMAVNPFSGLVHTARHTMGAGHARSRYLNCKEGDAEGRASDWSEVVTRSLSVLTRIAKLAIHVRLTCASFLSGLRAKPTYTCAFTIADMSFLESELKKALDLTNLSLPSCLGAHE